MSTDTHTVHLYAPVHQILEAREGDTLSYATFGSTDASDDYWGYICSREVSIDRPSREAFIPKQVAILRAAMTQVDLKAAQAKADLAEKIENLLSISYDMVES